MTDPVRRKVTENIYLGSIYNLEGTLAESRNVIDEWIKKHGEEAKLSFDLRDAHEAFIAFERDETDAEYKARLKKRKADRERLANQKAEQEAKEKEELERLLKKYPGYGACAKQATPET